MKRFMGTEEGRRKRDTTSHPEKERETERWKEVRKNLLRTRNRKRKKSKVRRCCLYWRQEREGGKGSPDAKSPATAFVSRFFVWIQTFCHHCYLKIVSETQKPSKTYQHQSQERCQEQNGSIPFEDDDDVLLAAMEDMALPSSELGASGLSMSEVTSEKGAIFEVKKQSEEERREQEEEAKECLWWSREALLTHLEHGDEDLDHNPLTTLQRADTNDGSDL